MSGRNTGEKTENILIKVFKPCILTFADKSDKKWPQIQCLCWSAAFPFCHFFMVFFLFFCPR